VAVCRGGVGARGGQGSAVLPVSSARCFCSWLGEPGTHHARACRCAPAHTQRCCALHAHAHKHTHTHTNTHTHTCSANAFSTHAEVLYQRLLGHDSYPIKVTPLMQSRSCVPCALGRSGRLSRRAPSHREGSSWVAHEAAIRFTLAPAQLSAIAPKHTPPPPPPPHAPPPPPRSSSTTTLLLLHTLLLHHHTPPPPHASPPPSHSSSFTRSSSTTTPHPTPHAPPAVLV